MSDAAAHFYVPAGERLAEAAATYRELDESAPLDERRRETIELGERYVDAAVDGLVLGLITEGGNVSSFIESLMRGVASIVESVATRLLRRVLGKADAEVLRSAGEFFVGRISGPDDAPHLAIPLSTTQGATLARSIATGDRDALTNALAGIIDASLDHLYFAAFDVIPLGAMTGRAVRAGGQAIRSGAKKGSARAIRAGSEDEKAQLMAYLRRRSDAHRH